MLCAYRPITAAARLSTAAGWQHCVPSGKLLSQNIAVSSLTHHVVHALTNTQLPQRAKPSDIIVEGVDYDPDDLYSSDSSSSGWDAGATDNDNSSSSDDDDNDAQQQQPWPQRFPALHASIAGAMAELGGSVAPRLNWSSPVDALWLSSSNSLKCGNADEVRGGGVWLCVSVCVDKSRVCVPHRRLRRSEQGAFDGKRVIEGVGRRLKAVIGCHSTCQLVALPAVVAPCAPRR